MCYYKAPSQTILTTKGLKSPRVTLQFIKFKLEAWIEVGFFSNTRGGVTLESLTYSMPNDEMGAAIAMIICVESICFLLH